MQSRPRKLEDPFEALFESAPDAMLVVGGNGRILRVNAQAETLFGFRRGEMSRRGIETLIPERFRESHVAHRAAYHAEPRTRAMGRGLQLYALRKDGTEFPVDIMLSPVRTAEGPQVIAVVRDMTEEEAARKALRDAKTELEKKVRERTAELRRANKELKAERTAALRSFEVRSRQQDALALLNRHALEGRNQGLLFEEAVGAVADVLDVEFSKVLELSPDSSHFLLRAGRGWKSGHVGKAIVETGIGSQAGFTLCHNGPVVVEDAGKETRFKKTPLLRGHGTVSGASVVIHGREIPYGVLGAHTRRKRAFSKDDLHFLQSVADILAAAIERTELEEELLNISNTEQARIGQDLHDGLCQHLTGIEFRATVLREQLKDNPKARKEAERIGKMIREATSHARMLAHGLSPFQMDSDGLTSALRALAKNTSVLFEIPCRFRCPRPAPIADVKTALHLYRIAQEAVSNAVRHGRPSSILINLKTSDDETTLRISDNGDGLCNPDTAREARGMGLRIMRYRAEIIGASFRAGPAQGGGTEVVCLLKTV